MYVPKIAVSFTGPQSVNKARALAEKLKLPCVEYPAPSYEFLLIYDHERLTLADTSAKLCKPIDVDFLSGKEGYRIQHLQHELILKAVGCKQTYRPHILDATAGLAIDSFILASHGCAVQMLEKSPILAELIADGLQRFFAHHSHSDLNIQLSCVNAITYLTQQSEKIFDVIYLDPMFPHRKKSALVKKEMQILQKLLGDDEAIDQLFSLALNHAKKRVVVKRPLAAAALLSVQKPDIQYKGRSIRFDVYVVK